MSASLLLVLAQVASAAPQAADHVVRLEIVEGHGASSGDTTVTYRSGSLMRTDSTLYGSAGETTYADLASGLRVSVSRDEAGIVQSVGIGRFSPGSFDQPRRIPTGRRDRALGENCAIWRLMADNQDSGTEICETADGVLLWEDFWYPHGNRTVRYRRATSVERRPVRREELLPPRNLLSLAMAAPAPAAAPAETDSPDYEEEMVGSDPADGSYVRRRHGRFFSDEWRVRGEHSWLVSNGAISVNYGEDETGRPLYLQIDRPGRWPWIRRMTIPPRWEPVAGRVPEEVLGETCVWQDNLAFRSTQQDYECRIADGIALKTEVGGHWGPLQHFTARRLSRHPLRDEDFAPPARALDWATWGITPAP